MFYTVLGAFVGALVTLTICRLNKVDSRGGLIPSSESVCVVTGMIAGAGIGFGYGCSQIINGTYFLQKLFIR